MHVDIHVVRAMMNLSFYLEVGVMYRFFMKLDKMSRKTNQLRHSNG